MRIGTNPVRNRYQAYAPQRIGVVSITFVPVMDGFFKEAINVIEVHLHSLRKTLGLSADILVFDNCSCDEATEFLSGLYHAGVIDFLMLSNHNLGKTGSLNWVFSSMPHEFIVSTDSDVLFRPGWAERSLEVFDSFEQAGIVSAQPAFFNTPDSIQHMAENMIQVMPDIDIRQQAPFPEAFEEYCDGINASDEVRQMVTQNQLKVATNSVNRVEAVLGSTSMQFMIRRDVARQLVPLPAEFTLDSDDHQEINRRMQALGFFQLSLPDALVYHMGNTLQSEHIPEANRLKLEADQIVDEAQKEISRPDEENFLKTWLIRATTRSERLKQLVKRLYAMLFDVLYAEKR
jgi:GT2 family glycosyltransferase